jgi:hypothetical protein
MDAASACGFAASEAAGQALWTSWCERAAGLQALLNDCSRFLAPFDVRKAQEAVAALLEHAGACRARVVPRQRFSFTRRPGGSVAASASAAGASSAPAGGGGGGGAAAPSSAAAAEEDEYTIQDLSDQVVVVARDALTGAAAAEVARLDKALAALGESGDAGGALAAARRRAVAAAEGGRDLRLQRLTRCTIVLLDRLTALRCDALADCALLSGPVEGSVLLHGAQGCVFALAARQFRIHTSTRCAFAIHALSRPIIEHCSGVQFAPYPLQWAERAADFARAALDKPSSPHLWRAVDDFGWHRTQHSPNWAVLRAAVAAGVAERLASAAAAADAGGALRLEEGWADAPWEAEEEAAAGAASGGASAGVEGVALPPWKAGGKAAPPVAEPAASQATQAGSVALLRSAAADDEL